MSWWAQLHTVGRAGPWTPRLADREVIIDYTDNGMQLKVGGGSFARRPVEAASGAKYPAVSDPATILWSTGTAAIVAVRGPQYPECQPVGTGKQVFRSRGNEPGWSLEMDDETMTHVTDYGKGTIDNSRATLNFGDDGRLCGRASCNS